MLIERYCVKNLKEILSIKKGGHIDIYNIHGVQIIDKPSIFGRNIEKYIFMLDKLKLKITVNIDFPMFYNDKENCLLIIDSKKHFDEDEIVKIVSINLNNFCEKEFLMRYSDVSKNNIWIYKFITQVITSYDVEKLIDKS